MHLIQNNEIVHRTVLLSREFEERGVAFELLEDEYENLTKATKWFKNEFLPDGNSEELQEFLISSALVKDDKALFVFNFLVLHWNSSTHIRVEKSGNFVLVKVSKIVGIDR